MTREIVRDEQGASAVEYGLLVAGIAAVVAFIIFALGSTVQSKLNGVNSCISSTTHSATTCPTG
jgi:pilus assembly protein Flp/PilA